MLWPKPYTIVMNREAFDALTSEQQEILREAGREALGPELDELVHDSSEALSAACARGALTLVSASAADLAALREAVQPVYEELESDPETERADRRHHRDALCRARRGLGAPALPTSSWEARRQAPPRSKGAGS